MTRLLPLLLILAAGCSGISGTNVGSPTPAAKRAFLERLERVRAGMPADSLEILFGTAEKAGETGILFRSRIITDEFTRESFQLGWKDEPLHQGEFKSQGEIDQVLAIVEVEDGRVLHLRRSPRP